MTRTWFHAVQVETYRLPLPGGARLARIDLGEGVVAGNVISDGQAERADEVAQTADEEVRGHTARPT